MKLNGFLLACAAVLLLTGFCGLAQADYISTLSGMSGLVSNWHMNETSGNVADSVTSDTIDGDNPGSFTGTGYTQGVAGPRPSDGFLGFSADNKSVDFADDNSTYLEMASCSGYAGLKDATLIAWAKFDDIPTSSSDRRTVGGLQRNTSSGRYILCAALYEKKSSDPNAGYQLYVRRNNATATGFAKRYVDPEEWHMLAITFEDGQYVETYIDGVNVDSLDFTNSFGLETPTTLMFGADCGTDANRPWKGEIDEIAMFDRALSSTEVTTLWNAAQVPEPSTVLMLVLAGLGVVIFGRRSR